MPAPVVVRVTTQVVRIPVLVMPEVLGRVQEMPLLQCPSFLCKRKKVVFRFGGSLLSFRTGSAEKISLIRWRIYAASKNFSVAPIVFAGSGKDDETSFKNRRRNAQGANASSLCLPRRLHRPCCRLFVYLFWLFGLSAGTTGSSHIDKPTYLVGLGFSWFWSRSFR